MFKWPFENHCALWNWPCKCHFPIPNSQMLFTPINQKLLNFLVKFPYVKCIIKRKSCTGVTTHKGSDRNVTVVQLVNHTVDILKTSCVQDYLGMLQWNNLSIKLQLHCNQVAYKEWRGMLQWYNKCWCCNFSVNKLCTENVEECCNGTTCQSNCNFFVNKLWTTEADKCWWVFRNVGIHLQWVEVNDLV